jgi:hypothetical protein
MSWRWEFTHYTSTGLLKAETWRSASLMKCEI